MTTFGTAVDVTVSELSVEAFFPADAETADWLRQRTRSVSPVEAWQIPLDAPTADRLRAAAPC